MDLFPGLHERLEQLLSAFLAENEKLNLTALRTPELSWHGNILDSLAFQSIQGKLPKTESLMDVGTGGGFPLLPLALMMPEARCVGMDSIGKKIAAIQRIVDTMKIPNVTLIPERAEVLGHNKKHREKYDVVTSRAVAPLNVLLEWVSPFCKVGGHIVLWKSLNIEQELKDSEKAQRILHCPLLFTQQYTLEKDFGTRQLLVFRKDDQLVKEYPREIGMAKRSPLL